MIHLSIGWFWNCFYKEGTLAVPAAFASSPALPVSSSETRVTDWHSALSVKVTTRLVQGTGQYTSILNSIILEKASALAQADGLRLEAQCRMEVHH